MALNYIWVAFFLIAFAVALAKLIFLGDTEVFQKIVTSTFDTAKTGYEIALGLTGVMTLWLGLMRVGEQAGAVQLLARAVGPFFQRLFPEIPAGHPVFGSILMNFSANMLGLDNAATPLGLKAMREMQDLNPHPGTASNAQIMFLVLNTSGLTIIPLSIMAYRAQAGAANPADVFVPILLATFFSTLTGLVVVSIYQKINLLRPIVLAYLGTLSLAVAGLIWWLTSLPPTEVNVVSTVMSSLVLFGLIIGFIGLGLVRGINIYENFIEGAKEGFQVAITIIPYLVAMLVAIGVFRAAGAMELLMDGIRWLVQRLGLNADFVEALPTALMKPLSGSGARGMMLDAMKTHGADSFVGRVASTIQGSTETTFYILAVYFGSVGIKRTRYALAAGLLADLAGVLAAIVLGYVFFGGAATP